MAADRNGREAWDRRRGEDRRQRDVPIDFPDRRKGDRRRGEDRSANTGG